VVDQITAPSPQRQQQPRDRTTRQAALWATAIALPVTIAVAVLALLQLRPDPPAAGPSIGSTAAPRVQSTAPVSMPAPPLADRPATVCRALTARLPAAVRDLRQRPVTAGPEQNAAYGDPALTVACGVPTASFPPTDDVWVVNRVCWHAAERSDAVLLTTVDREVPVQVTVPRAYEQPLQWIAPISETIVAAVPSAATAPQGCRG
jgi:Protein of unknown function (DUF3515)